MPDVTILDGGMSRELMRIGAPFRQLADVKVDDDHDRQQERYHTDARPDRRADGTVVGHAVAHSGHGKVEGWPLEEQRVNPIGRQATHADDLDGDGLDNMGEWVAGTRADDPDDALRLRIGLRSPGRAAAAKAPAAKRSRLRMPPSPSSGPARGSAHPWGSTTS